MVVTLQRIATHLTPDEAILIASLGVSLIFLECNRPGRIVPGALGLLLTLLATGSVLRWGVHPWAVLLLAGCVLVYLANLWRIVPIPLLGSATIALVASLRYLVPAKGEHAVRLWVAILCGGVLGTASAALARVAQRARRSKALD